MGGLSTNRNSKYLFLAGELANSFVGYTKHCGSLAQTAFFSKRSLGLLAKVRVDVGMRLGLLRPWLGFHGSWSPAARDFDFEANGPISDRLSRDGHAWVFSIQLLGGLLGVLQFDQKRDGSGLYCRRNDLRHGRTT